MNGEKVGRWSLAAAGSQEFAYAPEWLDSPLARAISLSMPLRPSAEPYRGPRVTSFFENLLPDNRVIRARLQSRFGTPSTHAFDLLSEIGRDCVGALQLLSADSEPHDVRKIRGQPLKIADIDSLLAGMLEPALGQRVAHLEEAFRISIAGAQEKTALLWHENRWHLPLGATPTTHILKLPIGLGNHGIDLRTSVENEWLCSRIVRAFGVPIAATRIETFGRYRVLVVERFDRRLTEDGRWWIRLPQEDMCQATGTPPALKYE